VHIDGVTRRGSDERQCLRTARSRACRPHASRGKRESVPHCNRGVFRKNSPKVFCVEHDQMIRAVAPDRADQAFSISILAGRAERRGRSRIPIARTRALNATPNAPSLSRMRYFGALSQGNASVVWRATTRPSDCGSPRTTTSAAVRGLEQEMRIDAERQWSAPQRDRNGRSRRGTI
jgi:hypothetical protein